MTAKPREPYQDLPACPGPDCLMCGGAACDKCGAGCWSNVRDCEHDVVQRHEPPTLPKEGDPRP